MGRLPVLPLLIVAVTAGACGGTQIPKHSGYKGGSKAKPWKKAKTLKFDDKMEAKVEGDLAYADYRRSAWFVADPQRHPRVTAGGLADRSDQFEFLHGGFPVSQVDPPRS